MLQTDNEKQLCDALRESIATLANAAKLLEQRGATAAATIIRQRIDANHPGDVVFELQTNGEARLWNVPASDRLVELIPDCTIPVDMLDGALVVITREVQP